MHPKVLFFVLLFLPNTSLSDWQTAAAPSLHSLMELGSIGVMNARTSETDRISTDAGVQTVLQGQRASASVIGYAGRRNIAATNLIVSLKASGVRVADGLAAPLSDSSINPGIAERQFVVETLPVNLSDADKRIRFWWQMTRLRQGRIMIVSPNPSPDEYKRLDQLTPLVVWGKGVPPGFLWSASTRSSKVIVNTDIAPTIAQNLGVTLQKASYGSVLHYKSGDTTGEDCVTTLAQRDVAMVEQAKLLRLMPYIAGSIAAFVLIAAVLRIKGSSFAPRVAAVAMCSPLFLGFSFFPLVMVLIALAATAVLLLMPSIRDFHCRLLLLVAYWITADTAILSGHMLGNSMLGYSAIEGARYYGIGNETMGVYVGLLTVVSSWFSGKWLKLYYVAIWTLAGLIVGLPFCGAKAGGLIVCAVCLAITITSADGHHLFGLKSMMAAAASVIASVVLLVVASHLGPQTHVTHAVDMTRQTGGSTLTNIILRKAGMDVHLVFHSVWIWVLLFTSYGRWQSYRDASLLPQPFLRRVGTAAVLACLFFNDAGVVAAALCNLMIWGAEANNISTPEIWRIFGRRRAMRAPAHAP
jgi:hypothetical protein